MAVLIWVLTIYIVIPPDILLPPLRGGTAEEMFVSAPSPVGRFIKLSLLLIGAATLMWRSALSMQLLPRLNRFFVAFLVLVPLSFLWSISPGDTLARYISILSAVMAGLAFAVAGWHPRRMQNVLRPVITLLLVGSLIFGVVMPEAAIARGEGTLENAWRGLTAQKNAFGQLGAFGAIFWVQGWLAREIKWWKALAGAGIAFTCILLSKSSTSLLTTVFASVLLVLLLRSPRSLRRYLPLIIAVFTAIVLTYAVAVLKLVPGMDLLLLPITEFTGKDLTFSNRSEIWKLIKLHIELNPLLGTGYGAYWTGPLPSSPSYVFLEEMYFYPTESHNGYLEVANDLGFVGLACLIGYLIVFVRQSLQLMKVDRAQGALYLAFFFQQAVANLSESYWLAINAGYVFIFMTLLTISMSRSLLDLDMQRRLSQSAIRGAANPR